jgi:photosystem II stability/assembly factor-like uncharacterized protein
MVDEDTGYVVGDEGLIFKTTDGGIIWMEQYTGEGANFNSVYFIDANNGCTVGDYGRIYGTTNGGMNWILRFNNWVLYELYGVSFSDSENGLAAGINGLIMRTINGGLTWYEQSTGVTEDLRAIDYANLTTAVAVGEYGTIIRTTDGGSSWTEQSGGTVTLYSVSFRDELNGMAGGGGTILQTTDGGITWFSQIPGTPNSTRSVCYLDINYAAAVGAGGMILTTTTGGTSWDNQLHGNTSQLNCVSFIDELNGIAGGGSQTTLGVILSTSDGGQNWNIFQPDRDIYAVAYKSDGAIRRGWAAGNSGRIYRTEDGLNWTMLSSGTTNSLLALSFVDLNVGWAVGWSGTILKTTDAGNSWTTQSGGTTYALRSISFTDEYTGTIVADAGLILRTTNGGNNWFVQTFSGSQMPLEGVSFLDANRGLIVGWSGIILRTTDGGNEWIYQPIGENNTLIEVCYVDSNTAYIVSNSGGLLFKTTDGGITWNTQKSRTTNALFGVHFSDANTGTVVGSGGTILRTINGGIPVELISFTTEVLENKVELNWSTATETNNSGFEILRSANKDEWNKLGFVPGHGTTTETQHYSFTDNDVSPGKYQYKLKQIGYDGTFEYSQVVEVEIPLVNEFSLSQNYPNPFNPTTSLQYTIGSRQFVTLKVYDLLGREIATLVNEEKPAGEYEVEFDGSALTSGIYFYQLKAGEFTETRKMILLK